MSLMMRRLDLRAEASRTDPIDYRSLVPRAGFDVAAALATVEPIVAAVRTRGEDAIHEFSARFDGVEQTDIRVPPAALAAALAELDPEIRAGLEESIRRLRITCAAELEHDVVTPLGPGATVTHRMVPVDRVGLYVPGGLAPLVSSVLMNVVPAQVAGAASSCARLAQPRLDRGPRLDERHAVAAERAVVGGEGGDIDLE